MPAYQKIIRPIQWCTKGGRRDFSGGKRWRLQWLCQAAGCNHSKVFFFGSFVYFYKYSVILKSFSLLRNVLGTKKLGDILSERESIANEMQDLLREATEAWGVTVERVEVVMMTMMSSNWPNNRLLFISHLRHRHHDQNNKTILDGYDTFEQIIKSFTLHLNLWVK